MQNKFIVGIQPRSGTTLYTIWLGLAGFCEHDHADWEIPKKVKFNCKLEDVDWNMQILHTHDPWLLDFSESDRHFVWCHRNLFDCVLSQMIAAHTTIYHLPTQEAANEYKNKHKDIHITLEKKDFVELWWSSMKNIYITKRILSINKCQYTNIYYDTHAHNQTKFYQSLNICTTRVPPLDIDLKKIPINKYAVITNLSELLDLYKNTVPSYFDPKLDPQRDQKIAEIEDFCRQQ